MQEINYKQIADFILSTVQTEAILNGFQYIVRYHDIEEKFNIKLDTDEIDNIYDVLSELDEIAAIDIDKHGGFNVVLYTAYAPNYSPEEYE